MADYQMSGSPVGYGGQGGFQTHTPEPGRKGAGMGTYANVAGAAVSLALLLGVGIWGYQLLVRDVSGVPVVKATSGPWRVAPENPGGEAADHQGLAVNEVAGRGTASGPVDRVALAPQPVGLEEEDVPREAPRLRSQEAAAQTELATLPDTDEAAPVPASLAIMTNRVEGGTAPKPDGDATIQALVDQVVADAMPLGDDAPAAGQPVKTALKPVAEEQAPVVTGPGVRRSPRPRNRPAELVRASQVSAVTPVAATPAVAEVATLAAADLATGTRLVQLGAYESAEVAEQEWGRISGRFDSFFDGKARVIQKAKSGGRTFYRLRAHGFGDLAEARRFCAALVAERADCIPVVVK
ncbi:MULTISPECIES: SPOR domain-containing protein [Marinovum]|jgi:cell division protein FtsN|uniref:Sporulation related domain-containing protein n=3 Tax=Marinovum algicola TaxID=42444 RepID=A0A975ZMN1_9RHOB|nr:MULTISPECIES: SPOR domain-containing protein [Marinovum]MDD9738488.1 SPOR domain-containing protein [Marinovum sp. SP66]MDD9742571.1 SPOR domain-containing protein [Marinovum sp. PR37]SEJ11904.1 Sporulation related domain-containing protein [Marinovum algicola]SLN21227.1 Sporulation related domain protein [Marinovum algicola]